MTLGSITDPGTISANAGSAELYEMAEGSQYTTALTVWWTSRRRYFTHAIDFQSSICPLVIRVLLPEQRSAAGRTRQKLLLLAAGRARLPVGAFGQLRSTRTPRVSTVRGTYLVHDLNGAANALYRALPAEDKDAGN
jgi:hypothetical protein